MYCSLFCNPFFSFPKKTRKKKENNLEKKKLFLFVSISSYIQGFNSTFVHICCYLCRFLPGFAPFVDGTVIVGHGPNSNNFMSLPIGSAISRYIKRLTNISVDEYKYSINVYPFNLNHIFNFMRMYTV